MAGGPRPAQPSQSLSVTPHQRPEQPPLYVRPHLQKDTQLSPQGPQGQVRVQGLLVQ